MDTITENPNREFELDEYRMFCKVCQHELPEPILEDRGGAYPGEYTELVIYCPCGATYIA